MIIIMQTNAEPRDIDAVIGRITELGYRPHLSTGDERVIIGVIGNDRPLDAELFVSLRGVDRIVPILKPYKLASREYRAKDTVITVPVPGRDDILIGGEEVTVMAGPCSVESREQTFAVAEQLAAMGVRIFRGGAFKPRTSPYSFQGLGIEALKILADVREQHGMAIITEVMAPEEVEVVAEYVDILQLGTRNMQNYRLLEAVGASNRPVLLKRGMSSTLDEMLLAAEYILSGGNQDVMLCERGIRTYEPSTRSTCDINAIPVLKSRSHLPVILDPSHATGYWNLVPPVSYAGIAAGADGLIVEVHTDPELAMSDGGQSLRPSTFFEMMTRLGRIAGAVDRTVAFTGSKAPVE